MSGVPCLPFQESASPLASVSVAANFTNTQAGFTDNVSGTYTFNRVKPVTKSRYCGGFREIISTLDVATFLMNGVACCPCGGAAYAQPATREDATGLASAGAVTLGAAISGQSVQQVRAVAHGTDISSDFETSISADGFIQQTGGSHAEAIYVFLVLPDTVACGTRTPTVGAPIALFLTATMNLTLTHCRANQASIWTGPTIPVSNICGVTITQDVVGNASRNAEQLVTIDPSPVTLSWYQGGALSLTMIAPDASTLNLVVTGNSPVTPYPNLADCIAVMITANTNANLQITQADSGFRVSFIGKYGLQSVNPLTVDSNDFTANQIQPKDETLEVDWAIGALDPTTGAFVPNYSDIIFATNATPCTGAFSKTFTFSGPGPVGTIVITGA